MSATAACQPDPAVVQVRLHSGGVSLELDTGTTHLVLLDGSSFVSRGGGGDGGSSGTGTSGAALTPVDPAALLAAVSGQLGGVAALQALRGGLQGGRLRLVTARCSSLRGRHSFIC